MRRVAERSRQRRSWAEVALPVLLLSGAWALVAGVSLFGVWIANLSLLAYLVYAFVGLLALGVTAYAVRALWTRRGRAWAVPALVLTVIAAVAIVRFDWTSVFVHGYYRLYRGDFAAVSALASGGGVSSDEYYGGDLPSALRHLSINGKAARIGSGVGSGSTAVFLPQWIGIPDGAVGYAYLSGGSATVTFDCFADPCRVRWSLGDGWYWLERS